MQESRLLERTNMWRELYAKYCDPQIEAREQLAEAQHRRRNERYESRIKEFFDGFAGFNREQDENNVPLDERVYIDSRLLDWDQSGLLRQDRSKLDVSSEVHCGICKHSPERHEAGTGAKSLLLDARLLP